MPILTPIGKLSFLAFILAGLAVVVAFFDAANPLSVLFLLAHIPLATFLSTRIASWLLERSKRPPIE